MVLRTKGTSLLSFIDLDNNESQNNNNLILKTITNVNNPHSIHGIYPYRGKISSVDVSVIISQLQKGMTLLDPFCGTGTIVYEAYRYGMNVIGVDNNPLAVVIAKGKMNLVGMNRESIIKKATKLVHSAKSLRNAAKMPSDSKKAFHSTTADEIMRIANFYDKMPDYLRAVFLGTVCLAARGCNHYLWTSTSVGKDINPKKYVNFYEKFLQKVKKHLYPLSNESSYQIHFHDSRELKQIVEPGIVDYVFTSPPYFDALDYTSYYARFIYPIIGLDRTEVRRQLIQNVKTYEEDMKRVLSQIDIITKNNALIIFVVGDKKMSDGTIINGGKFFSKLLHHKPNHVYERNYTSTPSRQIWDTINKTKRKEQIVIWDKSTW